MNPTLRLGTITAAITLILDQASKLWLLRVFHLAERGAVAGTPFFDLVLAWNVGISFGWFQSDSPTAQIALMAVKAVAVIVLAISMIRSRNLLSTLALGMIIGGALGNLIDRLRLDAVVDFLDFHLGDAHFYVFNIGDSAICIGVGVLLLDSLLIRPESPK